VRDFEVVVDLELASIGSYSVVFKLSGGVDRGIRKIPAKLSRVIVGRQEVTVS
jgi:hypothetical protein